MFLVGTKTIRLTANLTNYPSNFSVNLNGSALITALTLSLICLILRSTMVTASPAPVVSNAVPIVANLVSNHTELMAPSPSTLTKFKLKANLNFKLCV